MKLTMSASCWHVRQLYDYRGKTNLGQKLNNTTGKGHRFYKCNVNKIKTVMMKINCCYKCWIINERLTWLFWFRHGGLSYVGHSHFSFYYTLQICHPFLFTPPLASLSPPSLRNFEEGGRGKKTMQGGRVTQQVSLEILSESNLSAARRPE